MLTWFHIRGSALLKKVIFLLFLPHKWSRFSYNMLSKCISYNESECVLTCSSSQIISTYFWMSSAGIAAGICVMHIHQFLQQEELPMKVSLSNAIHWWSLIIVPLSVELILMVCTPWWHITVLILTTHFINHGSSLFFSIYTCIHLTVMTFIL